MQVFVVAKLKLNQTLEEMVMRKSFVGVSVVLAAGMAAWSAGRAQELPPRIKVGMSVALTGPGSAVGVTARIAAEMTVKEINAAGGIAGRPVDLALGDDAGDPTRASTEARRLIESEKVNVLIGPAIAAPALAAAPVVTAAKMMSFPFTGATSINSTSYPYGFGMFYPSDAFLEAMVDFAIDKLGAKNIGVMADTGAQGKAAAEQAKVYIPKRGAKLVDLETGDYDATDYTPQVLNLKRANPDVVIQVTSVGLGGGYFYKSVREQNWNIRIVSQISSLFPADIQKIAGSDAYTARRMYGLTTKSSTYCPGEDPSKLPYVQFIQKIKAYAPNDWQKVQMSLAPYYTDTLYLIKAAIEAKKTVDGPTLAAWVLENAPSVKPTVVGKLTPVKDSRFLYHADVFAFTVRPDQLNEQGVAVREGC
jgi:branched-chain amino acid transport system substrate-binding protein